jgi:hypothetical protein
MAKAFAMGQVKSHGQTPEYLGSGHEAGEIGAKDGFMSSYTGKYYPHDSSEVLAMGLQALYEAPMDLYQQSPNHFAFTLAALHGMLHQGD